MLYSIINKFRGKETLMEMDKRFLLTKEEMNAINKLIVNTNVIARRACEEGYMSAEEIEETKKQCDTRTVALAKLLAQTRREENE